MSSTSVNPFRPVKFEDESVPLIYISELAKQQFVAGNYFFTGKRGCGKTSILKVSDTIFRHVSPYLDASLDLDASGETFGTYINLNNRTVPDFFETRQNKKNKVYINSDKSKNELTSIYLELTILRNIVEYCSFAREAGILIVDRMCEGEISAAISGAYGLSVSSNIDQLQITIENTMTEMVEFSRSVRDDLPSYKTRLENKFHLVVGGILRSLQRENGLLKQIRILMDDCETLTGAFQAALNTLIRSPRNQPIAWSIAYVDGKYRASETNIINQTLSREERSIIYLDGLEASAYEEFCTEVARLRVQRVFPDCDDYDVRKRLSSFEIEHLIQRSFKNTTAKRALDFVERFKARKDVNQKMWQFFLEESGESSSVNSDDALRKKGLASYICICAKYRLPMYYAGFKTVASLSDGCIRDFLEDLGSIYESVTGKNRQSGKFLSTKVYDVVEQNLGCRDAASRKLSSISDYAEKNGYYLEKLISFLGHLMQKFQHDYISGYGLRSPDRSAFSIGINRNTDEYLSSIRDAEVDGYIRRVEPVGKQKLYCFRLHRQFTPNFDVAYRESSDDLIPIPFQFLQQIKEPHFDNPEKWAAKVFEHWVKQRANPTQGSFLEEQDD